MARELFAFNCALSFLMDSAVAIGLSVLVIKLIESTAIRPKVYFLMFRIYLVPSCRRVE